MFADRRKSERCPFQGAAKIQFGIGSLPRDCTIADVADGGVQIIAENLDVPAEFTPHIFNGAPAPVPTVGAEFIDHLVAAPSLHSDPQGSVRTPEYA